MTHLEIEAAIYKAVRKVKPSLTEEPLSPATRFDTYNISSLELAMITFEIEDHFDLDIADANLDTFVDIGEARDLVARLMEQAHGVQVVPA
jgi:acyl carrier protein